MAPAGGEDAWSDDLVAQSCEGKSSLNRTIDVAVGILQRFSKECERQTNLRS